MAPPTMSATDSLIFPAIMTLFPLPIPTELCLKFIELLGGADIIMVLAARKATYKLLDNPTVLRELENHPVTCGNAGQTLRTLRQTFCSLPATRLDNMPHSVLRKLEEYAVTCATMGRELQQAIRELQQAIPTECLDNTPPPILQELENHAAACAAAGRKLGELRQTFRSLPTESLDNITAPALRELENHAVACITARQRIQGLQQATYPLLTARLGDPPLFVLEEFEDYATTFAAASRKIQRKLCSLPTACLDIIPLFKAAQRIFGAHLQECLIPAAITWAQSYPSNNAIALLEWVWDNFEKTLTLRPVGKLLRRLSLKTHIELSSLDTTKMVYSLCIEGDGIVLSLERKTQSIRGGVVDICNPPPDLFMFPRPSAISPFGRPLFYDRTWGSEMISTAFFI